MAFHCSAFVITLFVCFSHVLAVPAEGDVQAKVKKAEETLTAAKAHLDHMLNMDPLPHHEKVPPIVKNETEHLAYEIKKLATKLHETVSVGEHKAEVKEAVNAAVTKLNEAAATLEHPGSDFKQDNSHYTAASDSLLAEAKHILAAGPCPAVTGIVEHALTELTHDIDNYQYGIHNAIEMGNAGGHENHHTVHHHHGASSEENSHSSEESHGHGHAHAHAH